MHKKEGRKSRAAVGPAAAHAIVVARAERHIKRLAAAAVVALGAGLRRPAHVAVSVDVEGDRVINREERVDGPPLVYGNDLAVEVRGLRVVGQ